MWGLDVSQPAEQTTCVGTNLLKFLLRSELFNPNDASQDTTVGSPLRLHENTSAAEQGRKKNFKSEHDIVDRGNSFCYIYKVVLDPWTDVPRIGAFPEPRPFVFLVLEDGSNKPTGAAASCLAHGDNIRHFEPENGCGGAYQREGGDLGSQEKLYGCVGNGAYEGENQGSSL